MILGLLAAPLAVEAQPAGKVSRIGMIMFGSPENAIAPAPFRQRLLELGYVEGQTAVLEMRYARGREEVLPELVSELVRLRVDAIFAAGDQVILAAKRATSTIPIVMVACDALAAGLVDSLSHPGGNLTGVSCLSSEIGSKRLALLREAVPKVSRVGVVWNAGDPGKAIEWRNTEIAARALGMTPTSVEVRSPNEIDTVLTTTTKQRVDALIVLGDALTIFSRRRIRRQPKWYPDHRLPRVRGSRRPDVIRPSNPAMYRHAADYMARFSRCGPATFGRAADEVRTGHQPQDQGPRSDHPPSLLGRADEVINDGRRAFIGTRLAAFRLAIRVEAQQAGRMPDRSFSGRRLTRPHPLTPLRPSSKLSASWATWRRNLVVERRFAEFGDDWLLIAAELVRLADLIVTGGNPSIAALK